MDNSKKVSHIVITGSTRGIGYGLAESFLDLGCSVTVCGRSPNAVEQAVANLTSRYDAKHILGLPCDVTIPEQVQILWDQSIERFGTVDIWINNAGLSNDQGMLWELSAEQVSESIITNVLGCVYGIQVSARGMLKQGYGAIYNMEGMGSDGRKHAGLTMYGTSKYALHYLTESLALELKGEPIVVGSLRPGMVMTDLITDRYLNRPEELVRLKKIFNIIADNVEKVTPWMAKRILENKKSGVIISYSSSLKLLWRFISQPFVKRDLFPAMDADE